MVPNHKSLIFRTALPENYSPSTQDSVDRVFLKQDLEQVLELLFHFVWSIQALKSWKVMVCINAR